MYNKTTPSQRCDNLAMAIDWIYEDNQTEIGMVSAFKVMDVWAKHAKLTDDEIIWVYEYICNRFN